MTNPQAIAIPERMKSLDLDKRGYPIPFLVLRDNEGTPHFTINDHEKWYLSVFEHRCSICGQTHDDTRWFVGGPASAFDDYGCYIDPPTHHECLEYALKVCPYLALPRYRGRIDAKTLDPSKLQPHILLQDNTMLPDRPEVFVAVEAETTEVIKINGDLRLVPGGPVGLEVWKDGKSLPLEEGLTLAVDAYKRVLEKVNTDG